MTKEYSKTKQITGYHVLFILLSFFAIVFGVNALFITKAISSFPGETSKKSYLQGINYNETLEENQKQNLLGWTAQIGVTQSNSPKTTKHLVSAFYDQEKQALRDLDVTAHLVQFSNDHLTFETQLSKDSIGNYSADLKMIPSGRWRVSLKAVSNSGETFVAHKDIEIVH
ncbi:FixH family protein [Hirschia litorea]|uniref:FixH family protein n=1 Tax=Hirschia litorea TaxID=1199156 RepID=A0ABW2II68_9PROT